MKSGLFLLLACASILLLVTAASAPAKRSDDCTWGASSVIVQDVNGQMVQSEPVTTGCIPR
jgi:hypothetical protein